MLWSGPTSACGEYSAKGPCDWHMVSYTGQGGETEREVHLDLKHGVEAKNYDDVSCLEP